MNGADERAGDAEVFPDKYRSFTDRVEPWWKRFSEGIELFYRKVDGC
jgi:hypothetical protein